MSSNTTSKSSAILLKDYSSMTQLSDLERDLLIEYQTLLRNLVNLNQQISRLTSAPTPQILESLRKLESKTSVVYTLLKASVYSIFMQQEEEQDLNYQQQPTEQDDGTLNY